METVKDFLINYNIRNNWKTRDAELMETLTEVGKVVSRKNRQEHRWYMTETVVVCIDDRYIEYTDYIITGDACMADMDLQYDLDKARFVERKTRPSIEVFYE